MVLFVTLPQATQNFDRINNGRLTHHHWLETAFKGRIAFNVLAILVESGGAYTLKFTAGQGRLENVGRIYGPFGGTGTNEGMDLINDKNHIAGSSYFFHDLLEALFEFTSVFGTSHQ